MVCHTKDWSLLCCPTIDNRRTAQNALVVIALAFTFDSSLVVIGSNTGLVFIDAILNSEITWQPVVWWSPIYGLLLHHALNFSSCLAFTFDSSLVIIGGNL